MSILHLTLSVWVTFIFKMFFITQMELKMLPICSLQLINKAPLKMLILGLTKTVSVNNKNSYQDV